VIYKAQAEALDSFRFDSLEEFRKNRAEKLHNAINAFHEALKYILVKENPTDYAMTQNNLGAVYSLIAELEDKERNLDNATLAYQEALRIYTHEEYPAYNKKVKANLDRIKQRFGSDPK